MQEVIKQVSFIQGILGKLKKKKKAQKEIIREDWGRRKGKTEKGQIPKGKAAG